MGPFEKLVEATAQPEVVSREDILKAQKAQNDRLRRELVSRGFEDTPHLVPRYWLKGSDKKEIAVSELRRPEAGNVIAGMNQANWSVSAYSGWNGRVRNKFAMDRMNRFKKIGVLEKAGLAIDQVLQYVDDNISWVNGG